MLDETILIAGGQLMIGNESSPLSRPRHPVTLASFRIMRGAVTNAQYARFVTDGGYRQQRWWTDMGWRWQQSKHDLVPAFWNDPAFADARQPIVGISWYEAVAYARWLADETGHRWRLPTEAEWEAAAQGDGTGTIHSAASGIRRTLPVIGAGYVSDDGIWQMRGNIWEWCSTRWGRNWQTLAYAYPYVADDGREDLGGSYARVMRGGSWFDPLQESYIHKRARFLPGSRASNIGLRLVCDGVGI